MWRELQLWLPCKLRVPRGAVYLGGGPLGGGPLAGGPDEAAGAPGGGPRGGGPLGGGPRGGPGGALIYLNRLVVVQK